MPLDELNHDQEKIMEHNAHQAQKEKIMEHNMPPSKASTSRRSFLRRGLAVGGAGGIQDSEVPGGSGSAAYTAALKVLDGDMDQYIHDNTEDEISHFTFLNAYLVSQGADPVNLERFRMLPSSQATGAQKDKRRLTNLMQLTVDTSWWTRYRSRTKNPDFGDTFPQAIPGLFAGQFPAIPRHDADLHPKDHLQAIANTAGFHFGFIEQGGTSLYPSLAQRVSNPEVLRILLSIGPTETQHFQTWQDKAGNAPPL